MNSRAILGISLAAFFAVSMTILPVTASDSSFLDIVGVKISANQNSAQITTAASIPTDGTSGLFGYGIPAANGVLGITSHGGAFDSEGQDDADDASFHTHLVTATPSKQCPNGVLVTSASFEEVGNANVAGNKITVANIDNDATGELGDPSDAFSFTLGPTKNGKGLCVNPHS
ncbi:MAG TPA: hypothetical protein VFG25_06660 [Nitrosopumilaceae archaeon]|nr:hypothetical protein [Nitrosopumilaceae archaeon]